MMISFENSNQFAMIPYDNTNLSKFVLNMNPDDIVDHYMYQVNPSGTAEKVHTGHQLDVYQIDRFILLREDYEEGAGLPRSETTIYELAVDKEVQTYLIPGKEPPAPVSIWTELANPDFLRQLFLPVVVMCVIAWQFYRQKPRKDKSASPQPRTKEEAQSEISRRISNLSSQIGGASQLHGEAQMH